MKHLVKLGTFMVCFGTFLPFTHAQPDSARQLIGFAHDNTPIHDLQFSKDGKYLMAISGSVVIWDIAKREKVFTHTMPNMAQNACLAKDTNLLAIKHNDIEIMIMEANNRTVPHQIRLDKEHSFVKIVAFAHKNQLLIVQQDSLHYFYHIRTGKIIKKQAVHALKYVIGARDSLFATIYEDEIKIYDFKSNQFLASLNDVPSGNFKTLCFDKRGQFIAIQKNNEVHLFETRHYKSLIPKYIRTCELNANEDFFGLDPSQHFYLAGYDTLKLWDMSEVKENYGPLHWKRPEKWTNTPLIFGRKITSVVFNPKSNYLAAGSINGDIKIWLFSNENVAAHYYNAAYEAEERLIRYSGEYELPAERAARIQKSKRAIRNKYLGMYEEKITTEKSPLELFLESK